MRHLVWMAGALAVAASSVGHAACAAKGGGGGAEGGSEPAGGAGGATTSSSTTHTHATTTSSTAEGGRGGSGGSGGSTTVCVGCKEHWDTPSLKLCQGTSADLYEAVMSCLCETSCAGVCGNNLCKDDPWDYDCQSCALNPTLGCGTEYNACLND